MDKSRKTTKTIHNKRNYSYFCPQSIKPYLYEQKNITLFCTCFNDFTLRLCAKRYGVGPSHFKR